MPRILRLTTAAALVAAAFATTPASAVPDCEVYFEGQRFGLLGATWYWEYPVVECAP